MKKALCLLSLLLLSACAAPRMQEPQQYDFGSLRAAPTTATLAPVSIAEMSTPAWLDSYRMIYRLAYASDQQILSYAHSRWIMPPAQLFEQRLKARIAQAGGAVLSANDGAANLPQLRIEAEDFSHVFTSPTQSAARVAVRVSLLRERKLVAQKTFEHRTPAQTADAAGGAAAMADASDRVIADMLVWLAGPALK